jgi:hypothetical protein
MKRFLMGVCLFAAIAQSNAVAAGAFPWFHTRPKPVLLDPQPSISPAAADTRVPYHGVAAYPGSGRLYFEDAYDRLVSPRNARPEQPSKSHLTALFERSWHFVALRSESK